MIRVVIADDHTMFLQGLSQLLATVPEICLAGQAQNGPEALGLILEQRPDLAILDISMPGMSGIEVVRELSQHAVKTRCILLTMHTAPELARQALDSGAAGYLLKENAFEELLRAVHAAADGASYISPALHADLFQTREPKNSRQLTPRETEVLQWIASGLTNKRIAKKLHISVKTVDTHRTRIMHKLDCHTAADLVRHAIKTGLV